ncbi:MAG: uroporphyrinogen-III synthase [Gammaproteobacteria bacterium]|uniref:Uroporphyrinogen-III synthase n=1 Tax=candidate division WWE3 bacterium TaxID=2053526 RepID=A0A928Y671_UNCKA|nr:uroporphyrinogen-III synthase [candidate division WWE3 bacterium]QOJ20868.1 MAG: uroporphyrinogen-III synthase [Gammaproteobacteria bacterium]
MPASTQLTGLNIVVTRPAHQSAFLAEQIRALGGNPILLPVLEIADVPDLEPLKNIILRLDEFDWAIFVSPNAVNKSMPLIIRQRALPAHLKIATVGKGSADTLKQYGVDDVLVPDGNSDSEALLQQAVLQHMAGQRVVIFRGNGGRQLLGDTLTQRGAQVEYAECYQRRKPDLDTAPLLADWSHGKIHAVIITSSEGLHNLFDIIGMLGQQLLKLTPVFTVHERIAQTARELGLEKIIKAPCAGDEGLLKGLQTYFQATGKRYN